MTIDDAKLESPNPQCFDRTHGFLIFDQHGTPVQSERTEADAVRAVRWLNDHEALCFRPETHYFERVTD